GADTADDLADPDRLADPHVDDREMAVAGGEAVAEVDLDHAAVAAAPAGAGHGAIGGGAHRFAGLAAEIQSGVHGGRADERIDAHAVDRRQVDLAGDRLAQGHAAERAHEPIDLDTRKADTLNLALERAGAGRQTRRHERTAGAAAARRDLSGIDAKLAEHAADALGAGVVAFLERGEGGNL